MRFWWQKEDPDRQRLEIQRAFRNVAATEDGKVLFTVLFEDLKVFDLAKTPDEKALSEYGKFLLSERMGINDSFAMIEALLSISRGGKENRR
jgi:hypothetical protein